jgi:hypothetical protein
MTRINRPSSAAVLCVTLALTGVAGAQTALFSNARTTPTDPGLATGVSSISGVPAPAGKVFSELQASAGEANAVAGFASFVTSPATLRLADDFEVPAGTGGWRVERLTVYAYPGSGGALSLEGATARFWNGSPALGASVVAGDATTNRLAVVTPTNMLRIFHTGALAGAAPAIAPDDTRPISAVELAFNPPVVLAPGTYFVDWQLDTAGDTQAFAPTITVIGQRTRSVAPPALPAGNALQFRVAPPPVLIGQWLPAIDAGKPAPAADLSMELPFLLSGAVLPAPCDSADIAGAGQTEGADGVLSADDIILFINRFFAADARADVAGSGQVPTPDGAFSADDIIVFIGAFFAGC